MSSGQVTRYEDVPAGITRYAEVEAVKPPATHAGWENFVSQHCARAVAVTPRSGRVWLATWGGVLAW
jgi:hypothetical protein